jgi:soluble lytic murein transglycosylase-like protein
MRDCALGVLVSFILLAGAAAYVLGDQHGARRASASAVLQAQAADATEARIMDFVLKRNPDATIREFQDFPRILLSESRAADIDFRLVMALIDKESQFNPRAVGKAGEIGLMQVLPSTGALVAKSIGIPFEGPKGSSLGTLGTPRHNLRIGIRFLKDRVDEFGGVNATAIRAYNRGPATAREHRPWDTYAESIALKYVSIVALVPTPAEAKQ